MLMLATPTCMYMYVHMHVYDARMHVGSAFAIYWIYKSSLQLRDENYKLH